ncbi:MAG TPA: DUF779 domain-containing protein [Solirubrobacterales bacterium]|jgi:uncharacterized protein (DUF779 family)|nr:DUF779 domain-containing protein [Solirubrobacterales bacterium]
MGTVIATPAAVDAIMRLRVEHRAIAFHGSSGGRGCDIPHSVTEAKLPPGINDLQLGQVGGVPFLVDADEYRRWGCPDLVIDVSHCHCNDGRAVVEGADCIRLTLSRNGSLSP